MPRKRKEPERPRWRRVPGERLFRVEPLPPPEPELPMQELPPGPEYLREPYQPRRLRRNAELYERQDLVEIFEGGEGDGWAPEETPWENRFPGTDIPFVDPLGGQRLSVSTFSVTVSSNVRGEGLEGNDIARIHSGLDYAAEWLFKRAKDRDAGFLKAYKVITGQGRGSGRMAGYPPIPSDIIRIDWRTTGREVGQRPKGGRVHIHGILKVWHYTQLQVNVKESQRFLNAMLTADRDQDVNPPIPVEGRIPIDQIQGVYVHVSYVPRSTEMLEIYGNKGPIQALQRELGVQIN